MDRISEQPESGVPLRIHVHEQDSSPLACEKGRQVDGCDRLPASTLLVHDRYRAHTHSSRRCALLSSHGSRGSRQSITICWGSLGANPHRRGSWHIIFPDRVPWGNQAAFVLGSREGENALRCQRASVMTNNSRRQRRCIRGERQMSSTGELFNGGFHEGTADPRPSATLEVIRAGARCSSVSGPRCPGSAPIP